MEDDPYTDVDLFYCTLDIKGVEGLAAECYSTSLAISSDRTSIRLYFDDVNYLREFHFLISMHSCRKRKLKR